MTTSLRSNPYPDGSPGSTFVDGVNELRGAIERIRKLEDAFRTIGIWDAANKLCGLGNDIGMTIERIEAAFEAATEQQGDRDSCS